MTKCPKCGKELIANATSCECGWTVEQDIQGLDDAQMKKKYVELLAQSNVKMDALNIKNAELETKVTTLENDLKETKEKTEGDIGELQGGITRVRANMPELTMFPGIPPMEKAGLPNADIQLGYEWYVNGLAYKFKQDHHLLKDEDIQNHKAWARKASPLFQRQFAMSDLFVSNVVPTGAMGPEQTGAGTEWMPAILAKTIISLMAYKSIFLQKADRVPLAVTKVDYPTGDFADVTAECPIADLEEPSQDAQAITTSTKSMIAQRGSCEIILARRFILNAPVYGYNVLDYIIDKAVGAYHYLIDDQAVNGIVATPHLLDGLLVDSDITIWNCQAGHDTWAELDYYDWTQAKYQIDETERMDGELFVGKTGRGILSALRGTTGHPLLHEGAEGLTTLDGYPVTELKTMPATEGDGECFGLWGDLKKGFMIGILEDINVRESEHVYFRRDAVLFDVAMYLDMAIKNAAYFRRMDMNTAQAGGDE